LVAAAFVALLPGLALLIRLKDDGLGADKNFLPSNSSRMGKSIGMQAAIITLFVSTLRIMGILQRQHAKLHQEDYLPYPDYKAP
jgi:hypothetical protein